MIVWGAVCVNCARTVLRGAGTNWRKVEMMWHRRETRRQTENTKLNLRTGSNLPTHPILIKETSLARWKHYRIAPEALSFTEQ